MSIDNSQYQNVEIYFSKFEIEIYFRVKPDDFYGDGDHYDKAANVTHNCDEMYPECEGNVISKVISTALRK